GIQDAVSALQQAWKADPRTSALAFPSITAAADASQLQRECPLTWHTAPQALALYCQEQGRILIDRPRLEALATQAGSWDAGVGLATALGQALISSSPPSGGPPGSLPANLQAFCFGGTLLGQAPGLRLPTDGSALSAAFTAFPARLKGEQGTPAQRAYALLTGLGGTASDCGDAAIANLAAGVVPDPEWLRALADPDRSTGGGAIKEVLKALCLPKPPLNCTRPRRLPPARVRPTP
ncbi:MAG: hypothetical protein ACK5N0_15890, partial [Synechococcaceae cyanobacterium]